MKDMMWPFIMRRLADVAIVAIRTPGIRLDFVRIMVRRVRLKI
jgi:hypothetical protein